MIKNKSRLLILLSIVSFITLCSPVNSTASGRYENIAGKVKSVQGSVLLKRADETEWKNVELDDTIYIGDTIKTNDKSRAVCVLNNDAHLTMDQGTECTIEQGRVHTFKGQPFLIRMYKGIINFFSSKSKSIEFGTAFVNGSVEGTEFCVRVGRDQTLISVFRGKVRAANEAGSLILSSGQSAIAESGKAPAIRIEVKPRDAVNWALYYPAIQDYRPVDFRDTGGESWRKNVQKSIELYRAGDLPMALSSLSDVPEDIKEPRFYTYRAGLLLNVGCVDEASDDIDSALKLDPSNSDAFALQAIIAVVQNRRDQALELARKAVSLDPKAPAARVALSYSQQARFDLEGALNSLKEAVELDPENALALARLSELWLSLGYLDKALETAQKAAALNPNLARTQTVLGFAYLAQIKTDESRSVFEKAIRFDQASPLPRLGLGLAKIRDGELEEGRKEIETAAALDPNNSLIRSYLGKAYFEEKRMMLDEEQYKIAKELDPQDPTPWLYDAINKQAMNRPVEALKDLQKSIELNDNRAVYRSRLLLDEDLAVRSASLGRIYQDLGFRQLALVEGWKSVITDPSNFSAHRFLADSYAALPRHEIARVSELLQSQLLQPININPVQPSLAESNLSILEGTGPSSSSFNEFNPLFNRNRLALQASGVFGDKDTRGGEIVQSGVWGKASYSLGGFNYRSDGFRKNNDLKQDIYNVFAQVSLSHRTSVQAEYRYKEVEKGDLELRFNPDDFLSGLRQNPKTESIRLGFHHSFLKGADIIGSAIFDQLDFTDILTDISPPYDFREENDFNGKTQSYELQYLQKLDSFNSIIGAGYLKTDNTRSILQELRFLPPITDPPVIFPPDYSENKIKHSNLYLYTYISFPENVIWTIGASGDFLRDKKEEFNNTDQFNPKLGLTWNPVPATTLRAAVFRVLKRTLTSTNQTLEPTQVAGFNQFYDDASGTSSWRYGIALDQGISEKVYGGLEYSRRDLDLNVSIDNPSQIMMVEWKEYMGRAYLYWVLHSWCSFKAEYMYEKQYRGNEKNFGVEMVRTHKFPLGISFFHPSGLNMSLMSTYFDQEGRFQRQATLDLPADFGSDSFWVIDAAISYRLPKRLGITSLTVKNLFDESFKYHDTDPSRPEVQPERSIIFSITLSF